jgi:hypothetical protein
MAAKSGKARLAFGAQLRQRQGHMNDRGHFHVRQGSGIIHRHPSGAPAGSGR